MVETLDSPLARLKAASTRVNELRGALAPKPQIGIILGSGLSALARRIEEALVISYDQIPHMPRPSVLGHQGNLLIGKLKGVTVACLSGRAHLYEGHEPEQVVFGARLLAELGVGAAILTNAAGGISPACAPGTLMLIVDHLNLTGRNPLIGPNEERWGTRFPDMTEAYSGRLRSLAQKVAREHGILLAEGTYAGLLGPTYETPAEIRMLETLGASAVGMSTVLETIALRHRSVEVLGISCITNHAAGKAPGTLSHDEVATVAGQASHDFVKLVEQVVASNS